MIRFTLVVVAVYAVCCAMAMGQSAPPEGNVSARTQPDPPPRTATDASNGPTRVSRSGSIYEDAIARRRDHEHERDPDRITYAALTPIGVPKPVPRLVKKHDVVTIIVREESQYSSKGTTDLKKSADMDAKIDAYVKLNIAKLSLDAKNPAITPEIKGELSRDFKGDAQVDRSDTFTARVGAEVLDVKPNGTIVIQARKRIKTDAEEQEFMLTGVCRAEDIQPDNTIVSNQLHDLDVRRTSKGATLDTTKRGWIPRLLDFANPF